MTNKNIYLKLKIPFATKSYIKKSCKGLKIKGNAYYIFDLSKQAYIDEYLELEQANFRLTDFRILKTKYYEKDLFKMFRKNYLDILSNENAENIIEITHQDLDEDNLKKINIHFQKMTTTVRNMFSCLSGSNPTGAESNNENTPLICINPEFFRCNFLNPLKIFAAKKQNKTKNYNNMNVINVDLQEFLNKYLIKKNNVSFKEIFDQYNDPDRDKIENILQHCEEYSSSLFSNLKLNTNCLEDEKFKTKNENFELFIDGYLNNTFSQHIEWKKFKEKLRSFYKWNVDYCISRKYLSPNSSLQGMSQSLIESAHIIPFASLVEKKDKKAILKSIDPYNCLRIDRNAHKLYDDKSRYFDLNGNLVTISNKKTLYLNMELLTPWQKEYLKESYEDAINK